MTVDAPVTVAFVCLGNICRSPMAEAVFQHVVKTNNLESLVSNVESFGTGGFHIGSTPDSRTVATCKNHNIPINHHAQQFERDTFSKFDYVFCMDEANLRNLKRIEPKGSKAKLSLFGKWRTDESFDEIVDDPYYGGSDGFEICYEQCVHFSEVFLKEGLGAKFD